MGLFDAFRKKENPLDVLRRRQEEEKRLAFPAQLERYHEKYGPRLTNEHIGLIVKDFCEGHLPEKMRDAPADKVGEYTLRRCPTFHSYVGEHTPDSFYEFLRDNGFRRDHFADDPASVGAFQKFFA